MASKKVHCLLIERGFYGRAQDTDIKQGIENDAQHLYVVELSTEKVPTTPLFVEQRVSGTNAPPWLRPFLACGHN